MAGTGTIDAAGKVGPIGGIQQKIVGARDAGARLFLVPPDNCAGRRRRPAGDMRLVKAETMHDAVAAIETWVADPDADLPSCEEDRDQPDHPEPELSPELTEPRRGPGPRHGRARDRGAHRGRRAGTSRPASTRSSTPRQLVEKEPAWPRRWGWTASAEGSLTPIEQDQLAARPAARAVLESIVWPANVAGCAAVVERLVLPPDADADIPTTRAAEEFAREHPDRQEVRIVAGVTRAGSTYCALRLRAHDDDQSVVGGTDLVPGLLALLGATLEEESP